MVRVKVITSVQRRRRLPTAEKIRLVEETMQPGMSVSTASAGTGALWLAVRTWKSSLREALDVAR
jgi:transposase